MLISDNILNINSMHLYIFYTYKDWDNQTAGKVLIPRGVLRFSGLIQEFQLKLGPYDPESWMTPFSYIICRSWDGSVFLHHMSFLRWERFSTSYVVLEMGVFLYIICRSWDGSLFLHHMSFLRWERFSTSYVVLEMGAFLYIIRRSWDASFSLHHMSF